MKRMQANATASGGEPRSKKKVATGIMAAALVGTLTLTSVLAYLTATDSVSNPFSLAKNIEIEVVEPGWSAQNAIGVLPTQTIAKDPAIHNLSAKEIYAFADVVIPAKDIIIADADGTPHPSAEVDLFTYEANPGWTLKDTIKGDGTVTYRYAYDQAVTGEGTTPAVFDDVTVCNYVDDQFDAESAAQEIVINGAAIQSESFADANEAYAAYFGETAPVEPDEPAVPEIPEQTSGLSADKVNAAVPVSTTKIVFSTVAQPTGDDLTVEGNGSITGVANGSTYTIANAEGGAVALPADSSDMFISKTNLATADLTGADASAIVKANRMFADTKLDTATTGGSWNTDNAIETKAFMPSIMENKATYQQVKVGEIFPTGQAEYGATEIRDIADDGKTYTMKYVPGQLKTYIGLKARSLVFSDEVAPDGIDVFYDLDADGDEGIAYWYADDIMYISSQKHGQKVIAPTNMGRMFYDCTRLIVLDINNLDTGNVTNMSSAFSGLKNLTSLDVSKLDTSNVVNMFRMFENCYALENLNVRGFDTSNVVNMQSMFGSCRALAAIDISGFNTSNVTDITSMFSGCYSLASIDVSSFDTRKITSFNYLFSSCKELACLDLSNFDFSNAKSMMHFFSNCVKLQTIYVPDNWKPGKQYTVGDDGYTTSNMFTNCISLVGGAGTAFNSSDNGYWRYSRIDGGPSNPGYLTSIADKPAQINMTVPLEPFTKTV